VPPFHVRSLYDYLGWLEAQLDSTGGTVAAEDGLLDVRYIGDEQSPTTLVLPQQRLIFHNGAYLVFDLRVNEDLELAQYTFQFARADDSLIWRLDKHPLKSGGPPVAHIHEPPDEGEHTPHEEVDIDGVVQRLFESDELY
jgi:hypothetical protein